MSETAAYEVLARKYRPRQFAEVVGQDHVTRTLSNALTSGRIAQAYLFVGPRGVGKTTLARIMAKAMNCMKGPTPEPCDACDACREIAEGRCLDVLEIDGASNNGVEQVRDLRDSARYAPARGPFKIYIIDEVHMLSIGAFNALLKILEEPPAHVKFIFATTEPQKVPATILSRCQRFDLRRIATRAMVDHLAKIAKLEKVEVDAAALLAIARGAEGGLRDAESALDQLMTFCGKNIAEQDVLSVFGLVAWRSMEELVDALLAGDIPKLLRLVAGLDEAGKDLLRLAAELLEYLRNLLVAAHAPDVLASGELADTQIETLRRQAAVLPAGRLARLVEVLIEAQGQLRFALARRTALEVALVRAARAGTVADLDEVLAVLAGTGGGGEEEEPVPATSLSRATPPPDPVRAAPKPVPPVAVRREETVEEEAAPAADELMTVRKAWSELLNRVQETAQLARKYLKSARPASIENNTLTLAFDPEFSGDVEGFKQGRNVRVLQQAVEKLLGRQLKIELVVDAASATIADEPLRDEPASPPAQAKPAAPAAARSAGAGKPRGEWLKDPAVQRTLDAFGGTIMDIRE